MAISGKGLFFSGIKHSGKTTFARSLAMSENMHSYDSDALVYQLIYPVTVRNYYQSHGKDAFMEKENEAVEDFLLTHDSPFIMSLGGGASDNRKLLETVHRNGKLVYLRRPEKILLPMILKDGIPPFLDKDDVEGSFSRLFKLRDRIYREEADLLIELGEYESIEKTTKMIKEKLKEAFK